MANNIQVSDRAGAAVVVKSTDTAGVHTPHQNVDQLIPGTGATQLGKAEDAAHTTGDVGVMALAVRNDAGSTLASTTGDYIPLSTDNTGALRVTDAGSTATAANQVTGNTTLASIDTKTPALGQALAAASVPVVIPAAQITTLTPPAAITGFATSANQSTALTRLGDVTETAPSTDTASSGLNGRLQRISQRVTSLIGVLPGSLGQKAKAASLAVTLASDDDLLTKIGEVQATPTANTVLDRLKALLTGIVLADGSNTIGKIDQGAAGLTPWPVQQAALAAVRDQVSVAAWNGTTYDQHSSNVDLVLIASGARVATNQITDQTNVNFRGIILYLNITVASGTGGLQVRIQGKDPASGVYQSLHTLPTAVIATGMTTYQFGSFNLGTAANMGQSATVILPRTWRLQVVHVDASSYTYSVGASLVRG